MSLCLMCFFALPLVSSAELVKKVDNFIILLDQSGSMAQANVMAGHQKLDQAVNAVTQLDQAVPNLGYTSGVAAFAPSKLSVLRLPTIKVRSGQRLLDLSPPSIT